MIDVDTEELLDHWEENGHKYIQVAAQLYTGNDCKISSGFVVDDPIEDMYLRLEKVENGVFQATMLCLTKDELAAIAWVSTGTMWSELYHQRELKEDGISE